MSPVTELNAYYSIHEFDDLSISDLMTIEDDYDSDLLFEGEEASDQDLIEVDEDLNKDSVAEEDSLAKKSNKPSSPDDPRITQNADTGSMQITKITLLSVEQEQALAREILTRRAELRKVAYTSDTIARALHSLLTDYEGKSPKKLSEVIRFAPTEGTSSKEVLSIFSGNLKKIDELLLRNQSDLKSGNSEDLHLRRQMISELFTSLGVNDEVIFTMVDHFRAKVLGSEEALEENAFALGESLNGAKLRLTFLEEHQGALKVQRADFEGRFLRLVAKFANKYSRAHREFDDLFQEGFLGLKNAVDKFEPNRVFEKTGDPVRFSTYASYYILQKIKRSIEEKERLVRVPVHHHSNVINAYLESEKRFASGEISTYAELKDGPQVSDPLLSQAILSFRQKHSLDAEFENKSGTFSQLGDLLSDRKLGIPEQINISRLVTDLKESLEQAVIEGVIDGRAYLCISLKYGIYTRDELIERFDVLDKATESLSPLQTSLREYYEEYVQTNQKGAEAAWDLKKLPLKDRESCDGAEIAAVLKSHRSYPMQLHAKAIDRLRCSDFFGKLVEFLD